MLQKQHQVLHLCSKEGIHLTLGVPYSNIQVSIPGSFIDFTCAHSNFTVVYPFKVFCRYEEDRRFRFSATCGSSAAPRNFFALFTSSFGTACTSVHTNHCAVPASPATSFAIYTPKQFAVWRFPVCSDGNSAVWSASTCSPDGRTTHCTAGGSDETAVCVRTATTCGTSRIRLCLS